MTAIRRITKASTGPLTSHERESLDEAIRRVNQLYDPPHASLYFEDKSETLTMNQNSWVQVTNATNDLFTASVSGMTYADDDIVIITPGDYIFMTSLSFSGTTNADVYEFALFKNNTLASPKIERTTTSVDIGNVSLPFYMDDLVAGDTLNLRIRNTANNFDATLISCSWVIWILHY